MSAPFAGGRRRQGLDIWPGFVDALATLLMVIIFVLMVFVLAQFYLGAALTGRDEALGRLNRQIAELTQMLSVERATSADLKLNLAQLAADLQSSPRPTAWSRPIGRRSRSSSPTLSALPAISTP